MKGKIKVLTVGTFDVPHFGHYHLFKQIKTLFPNSHLVVGVNYDEFIEKFKGKKPVFSYERRVEMLRLVDLIDEVVPNIGSEDSKPLILQVRPDVIVIGSDWMKKDYCSQMQFTPEWLEENHIALTYIPRYVVMSTSEIKRAVKDY